MHKYLSVTVPVANLRREPLEGSGTYDHDDMQESQLLYNERVLCTEEEQSWYRVEALEQKRYFPGSGWRGYPGWLRKSDACLLPPDPAQTVVTTKRTTSVYKDPPEPGAADPFLKVLLGTRFTPVDERNEGGGNLGVLLPGAGIGWLARTDTGPAQNMAGTTFLRKAIIRTAELFLGTPYLWGGRSICWPELSGSAAGPSRNIITGVDCSGLVNLVFRANGVNLPRDARDQWRFARRISPHDLKEGDLLFLSPAGDPAEMDHVMIFSDGESFLEAPETGENVRRFTFQEKFGMNLEGLMRNGLLTEQRRLSCGTVFND